MPPRYAYWTILAGGLPTAFRAAEKDELLPTYKRILEKQPDAVMKFFARGKLWDTPEQALRAEAGPRGRGPESRDRKREPRESRERDRDWRPGGEHRDPRQPFKDAKQARNQERRQERWDRKHRDDRDRPFDSAQGKRFDRRPPREKPHGDPMRDEIRSRAPRDSDRRDWRDRDRDRRPPGPKARSFERKDRPGGSDRGFKGGDRGFKGGDRGYGGGDRGYSARGGYKRGDERWTPREKPHGDKLGYKGGGGYKGREDRPRGSWQDRERERPFRPKSERGHGQEAPHPPAPPRPKGPDREPRPGQEPPPEPPPRPGEGRIPPPGPPERGSGSNAGGKLVRKKPRRE